MTRRTYVFWRLVKSLFVSEPGSCEAEIEMRPAVEGGLEAFCSWGGPWRRFMERPVNGRSMTILQIQHNRECQGKK